MSTKNKTISAIALVLIVAGVIYFVNATKSKMISENVVSENSADNESKVGDIDFGSTIENKNNKPKDAPEGMVWIPGGEFSMGCSVSNESLCGVKGITNDANPVHRVYVDGFWMDKTEVTNKQFAAFVKATGYVTVAEIKPSAEEFPGVPADKLIAGTAVFMPTKQEVPLNDYLRWWGYVGGANWRHPLGPDSSIEGKDNYPVVQVCYEDAIAYAKWAGKRLATEAEWEFAARGGKSGELYAWGNTLTVDDKFQANIYQGKFPVDGADAAEDGFAGIAPTAQYKANAYGLYDMSGNVWEWVNDWYDANYYAQLASENKVSKNPQGPATFNDPAEPGLPKRVHRGGSFLCTEQYCTRYMLGTRGNGEVKSAANHIGFRCVK
ncbi:formylglycine-generating enzyme required for sulfatase activity [Flavobacterium sp. 28A]|uniref:formylglycine-generating enzyme family protein n=1 Tax=Flavobacterium sp. 28A TaxID=2735895 RepID=UPI00156E8760|nr:formylglycine-generating enzyme family protein [Flavobacterium sp. 28A]NRT14957.1 formylglycine-generating enzyme required for sulfatase activity [Flavobacterium sp. 28A]